MTTREEFEFANDVRAALEERAPRSAWLIILAILFTFIIAISWASWATLDEVTTADGKVISSTQLQVVQTLEGGLVREIFVREGDKVKKGQPLMQIDDTRFSSKLGELRQQRWALLAEISRLNAEANGHSEIAVDKTLEKNAPQTIAAEQASFRARVIRREQEEAILQQQIFQKRQELIELTARTQKLESSLKPMKKELELTRKLNKRGVVPEIDMLRLERQFAELSGEAKVVRSSLPRAKSGIDEARNRLANASAIFKAGSRERLAKANAELAITKEAIKAAQDRVQRAVLKSPAAGVVNKVSITTIGAVVQPGLDVFTIVPEGDKLLIEARVRPKDIAFITPNQPASVKLTSYDYLLFGSVSGTVIRIGADTITDGQSQTFYRVIVQTDQNYVTRNSKRYPLIPGMIASVDILTGEKTVLDYLLKPINRVRNEALRER